MKHTIEELQFAAAVRELASALRSAARPNPPDRENRNSPEFLALRDEWDTQNPLSVFVPEAIGRITVVADIIKDSLKAS